MKKCAPKMAYVTELRELRQKLESTNETRTMFDQILSSLQSKAAPALMSQFGLDEKQAGGSITAATNSVKEVVGGGDGFGMDDVMNLFSDQKNSSAADGIVGKIGSVLQGKLMSSVGLEESKASAVSAMLVPMVTDLISKHVGGDAKGLQSLLGGGGLAGMAKGMLGNMFKR